jgi:capsular polysaccharide biosynthesis protein
MGARKIRVVTTVVFARADRSPPTKGINGMDLWELLVITARRWKVTLPVAILSFGFAFAAAGSVPPEYTAEAAVVIYGAQFAEDATTGELEDTDNPLVLANEGRSALAFAERSMVSSDQKAAAEEAGQSSSYTVTLDRFNPILDVAVVADTPEQAVSTAAYVVEQIESELRELQVQSGQQEEDLQLQPSVLFVDETASQDATPQTRMLIILLVLATLATIGTAVLADAFIVTRQRRRDSLEQELEPSADAEDWDEAQEMIESATRVKEASSVGTAGDDLEEWGRR